jgi:hypothetical protein
VAAVWRRAIGRSCFASSDGVAPPRVPATDAVSVDVLLSGADPRRAPAAPTRIVRDYFRALFGGVSAAAAAQTSP